MEKIKIISYNVDGLPAQVDIAELPWVLRPIAWIYKLVKGTTVVTVNDNKDVEEKARKIGRRLAEQEADIIAVQEDFNYHYEIIESLANDYNCGKYTGGFSISRIFKVTEWLTHFPLPRLKADGLNIITRKKRVAVYHENIVGWKKSCGYVSHANDLLAHKGFRHYVLSVGTCSIDLYIVHLDADFYDRSNDVSGDVEARRAQFAQLGDYIVERLMERSERPVVIVGDTNCRLGNEWDDSLDALTSRLDKFARLHEAMAINYTDVDRLFFLNNPLSNYMLHVVSCWYDKSEKLSDHYPLIVELGVTEK